ncbi:MAG: tRNA (adenosine(37)-N6)-threonylcarbamoyltransferase complex ATPase subunit type 1 TsaE [Pseudomonadales bacterium]|nr:tRNA (adenosine(37)-N6)-threonylcarbamoyltransferase complex ATPase subunit type 1 TsaE [Pseudomonadales bacterium]
MTRCRAGELGAGKTTLCRGIRRGLGIEGAVKSPTFTLVEPYETPTLRIFHFDLYRLEDPEELEYIGVDDYFGDDCRCLIEWPERGEGYLPACDLGIRLEIAADGREAILQPRTDRGRECAEGLKQQEIE